MIETAEEAKSGLPNAPRWRELVLEHPDPDRPNLEVWPFTSESGGFAPTRTRTTREYPMPPIEPHGVVAMAALMERPGATSPLRIDALIVPPVVLGWRIEALILTVTGDVNLRAPAIVDRVLLAESSVIPLNVIANHYYLIARNLTAKPAHFRGAFWCRASSRKA